MCSVSVMADPIANSNMLIDPVDKMNPFRRWDGSESKQRTKEDEAGYYASNGKGSGKILPVVLSLMSVFNAGATSVRVSAVFLVAAAALSVSSYAEKDWTKTPGHVSVEWKNGKAEWSVGGICARS